MKKASEMTEIETMMCTGELPFNEKAIKCDSTVEDAIFSLLIGEVPYDETLVDALKEHRR